MPDAHAFPYRVMHHALPRKVQRRLTSLAASFSLLLASFGLPGAQAIAVEMRATGGSSVNIQIVAPLNVRSGPGGLGPGSSRASTSLKGSLAPSSLAPKPHVAGGRLEAAELGSLPASPIHSVPALEGIKDHSLPAPETPGAGRERLLEAMGLPEIPAQALAPSQEQSRSDPGSREWADQSFRFLKGESFINSSQESVVAVEPARAPSARPGGPLKRWTLAAVMASVGIGILSHAGHADSFTQQPEAVAAPLRESGFLEAIGSAGYAVGNFLAFLFPLPEIYKTIKEGHNGGTPLWRVAVLATASMALGLVSATVAGKWFWGVQNIFGGLAILAVIPLGAWLSRRGSAANAKAGLSKPLLVTAAVSAAVLALSFALYFGAAAVVPALLSQLFSAAAIPQLILAIQVVTGIMYMLLFLPDILSLVKGTAPKGFTPAFSMLFFATSAAFVIWTAQMMFMAPTGSEQMQYAVYLAQNIAYSVVSLISFFVARKHMAGTAVQPGLPESARPPPPAQQILMPEEATRLPARPSPPAVSLEPTPVVKSFLDSLPPDVRTYTIARLMAEKDSAQSRARKIARDARLVSIAVNLDDPRSHWIFIFHSNSKKRILTVWQKRIGIKTLSSREPRTRVLWNSRMAVLAEPGAALEKLQASRPGFKAVRMEIRPRWKADPVYVFIDRKGQTEEVILPSKTGPKGP